jgi:hypothetical protein
LTWSDAHNVCDGMVDPRDIEPIIAAAQIEPPERIVLIATPSLYHINDLGSPGHRPINAYLLVTDKRLVYGKKSFRSAKLLLDISHLDQRGYREDLYMGGGPAHELYLELNSGFVVLIFRTEDARDEVSFYLKQQIGRAQFPEG